MRVVCFVDKSETMFQHYFKTLFEKRGWEHKCVDAYSDDMINDVVSFRPTVLLSFFRFSQRGVQELLQMVRDTDLSSLPFLLFSIRSTERDLFDDNSAWVDDFPSVHIVNKDTLGDFLQTQEKRPNKKRILYVDDSKVMHSFFNDSVEDTPYEIIEAYSGEEALQLYNTFLPDMVITDIEMPGMSGLDLCREIKTHNFDNRFIPVLILSSREEPLDIKTGFRYGADDYLTKPVEKVMLLEKIEEYFSVAERKSDSKVLILEYDRLHSEKISHAIMKNGITVERAYDVQTALQFIEDEHPDIAVVSLDLPDIDGLDLVRNLRLNKSYDDISFIALTSKSPDDMHAEAILAAKYGITKVFYKPFDLINFSLLLERLVAEKYASYKRENKLILDIISLLISSLEARDAYTRGHTERVGKYAMLLGEQMALSSRDLDLLDKASRFHDLGKIGVRDDILLKQAKLTDDEYLKIQEHSEIGAELLKPLESYRDVIPLILSHHERWDGKGYPEGIKGSDIPLGARIIAVADSYDAMTTDRPYRKGMSHEKAMQIIRENSGTQFCPRCAESFLKIDVKMLKAIIPS
ncbi:response regulator [bacterium]|nr:response regulator [bacterium]